MGDGRTVELRLPTSCTVMCYPRSSGDGTWATHVITRAVDVETNEEMHFGSPWHHPTEPPTEVIAEHVIDQLRHEVREQLGLNPHAETVAARDVVFAQISAERERQDERWGGKAHDDERDPLQWRELFREHIDRALKRTGADPDGYRAELVATAAAVIAAIEAHDRRRNGSP